LIGGGVVMLIGVIVLIAGIASAGAGVDIDFVLENTKSGSLTVPADGNLNFLFLVQQKSYNAACEPYDGGVSMNEPAGVDSGMQWDRCDSPAPTTDEDFRKEFDLRDYCEYWPDSTANGQKLTFTSSHSVWVLDPLKELAEAVGGSAGGVIVGSRIAGGGAVSCSPPLAPSPCGLDCLGFSLGQAALLWCHPGLVAAGAPWAFPSGRTRVPPHSGSAL